MSGTARTGQDRDIAAAYASGLSLRAVAEKFSRSKGAVKAAVIRAGGTLRPVGRPRKFTGTGGVTGERYLAGHSTTLIAREAGVSSDAVGRVLREAGIRVRSLSEAAGVRREREREESGEYPWAAEAAARHRAGESVWGLAREYGVAWRTAEAAIRRQGTPVALAPAGRPRGGAL